MSQTLHTIAPTILSPLLRFYIESESSDIAFTTIRRVLTALIHHCKSAEQFTPLTDFLVKEVVDAPKEDTEAFKRLLEAVVVVCSVRQGSRLTGILPSRLYVSLHANTFLRKPSAEAPFSIPVIPFL